MTYQVGDETVRVGAKDLPWEREVRPGIIDYEVRLNVSDLGAGEELTGGWCEIWIGDELCDREDKGDWCACYWDDGVWRGDPNDDSSKRLTVR